MWVIFRSKIDVTKTLNCNCSFDNDFLFTILYFGVKNVKALKIGSFLNKGCLIPI